ncbi:PLP-dependent enzyme, glutamate decarboxylase [Sphaerochaeta pleomorpha str. Grapes]|uniref:PLP-dependent enzyme, glutamate decarboxylase n=1 Tax=Sphaerochaeta pleomorpha (strain ATCC BAA-1885 / DSM 22778 / Grapes) TaxID=158190 RepID=G8QUB0_SPHPG|nr:aspartate aminotransferase family protein [Sphaerochaeta pleomorpha]AEV28080.1 PLP-dependent enzyme, glutamate decarboxylase [Sphaerochaeta pleomorpha str. Grapes]
MQNDNIEPLFLSSSKESKEAYRAIIESTVTAILDSMQDEKAYRGMNPRQLQQEISSQTLLPEQGLGFPSVLDSVSKSIIPNFLKTSSTDYMAHLHSPALLESIASELILSTFNQSMDSWDQSPIATEVEIAVIKQLCIMYGIKEHSDGVFTSGGSQSNLSGITLARDWYCNTKLHHDVKKEGLPSCYSKFRIYTSEVSHFSMEKSAHLLGLGYNAVVKVKVDAQCKMDCKALEKHIEQDKEQGFLPIAVIATIGTTDYGSIDPIGEISAICKKEGLWLHGDAAYGSGVILSGKYAHRIASIDCCDSLTVDFHKMFLLPISCGAFLVKEGKNLEAFTLHADYLNREEDEEDGYTNLVGKSLQTTRRFDALKVWMAFQVRGKAGYAAIIDTCIENATYVYERLCLNNAFEVAIQPEISSVVFRLKGSCEVNKRVRRRLIHFQGVVIGQTVYQEKTYLKFTLLNPTVTHEKLDSLLSLIEELGIEESKQA